MQLRLRQRSGLCTIAVADGASLAELLVAAGVPPATVVLYGFPPRVLPPNCVLSEEGVRSGDLLILQLPPPPVPTPASNAPSPVAAAAGPSLRPARAAKDDAVLVIKEAAREDLQRRARELLQSPPPKALAGSKRPRPAPTHVWGSAGRTMSDAGAPAEAHAAAAGAPAEAHAAAAGSGGGAPLRSRAPPVRGRRRRALILGSREDIEAGLARSAAGGGGAAGDSLVDFFRSASRAALRAQYDLSRANSRLAAALAGSYSMRPLSDGRTAAGVPSLLEVRFSPRAAMGAAARAAATSAGAAEAAPPTKEVDVIDNLPAEAIVAVIRGVLASASAGGSAAAPAASAAGAQLELLKPHVLSLVSPRQFWAVVRFGGAILRASAATAVAAAAAAAGTAPPAPGSVVHSLTAPTPWGCAVDPAAALRALIPSADWRFLDHRARRLTDKALAAAAAAAAASEEARARRQARSGDTGAAAAACEAAPPVAVAPKQLLSPPPGPGPSVLALDAVLLCAAAVHGGSVSEAALEQGWARAARIVAGSSLAPAPMQQPPAAVAGDVPEQQAAHCVRAALERIGRVAEGAASPAAPGCALPRAAPLGTAPPALLAALRAADAGALVRSSSAGSCIDADDGGDEEEERAFVCGACGRTRLVRALRDGANLDAIEADDAWTCGSETGYEGGHGLARLRARGGCSAPDDELAAALADLGGDAAAAACAALGLWSAEAVASALVPEDEAGCLYAGPEGSVEGALAEPQAAVAAFAGVLAARQRQQPGPLAALPAPFARLAQRVPPLAVISAPEAGPEAAPLAAGVPRDSALLTFRHRGYKLALAAALLIVSPPAPPPSGDAAAATECAPLSASGDAAAALLLSPLGWAAAALLARAWQAYARGGVMAEFMAQVTSGRAAVPPGGAGAASDVAADDADAVLTILEAARIATPQDLASVPADLVAALFPPQRHRLSAASPGVSREDVLVWQAAARALIEAKPWLREVACK